MTRAAETSLAVLAVAPAAPFCAVMSCAALPDGSDALLLCVVLRGVVLVDVVMQIAPVLPDRSGIPAGNFVLGTFYGE